MSDLATDQQDMKRLLKVLSKPFENFLIKCISPHPYFEEITESYWPIKCNKRRMTFRRAQQLIDSEKLEWKLSKKFFKKGYAFQDMQK